MSGPLASALILTLDVDWAPDFVIDDVAQLLVDSGVKATWFVTHPSSAIDRLRSRPDLFELGIHPNFLEGSSQGETPAAVLRYCLDLVPGAQIMRTHGLVQSTPLLDLAIDHGLKVDVSLYLPHARQARPMEYWRRNVRFIRVPYVWEDDFEMERAAPVWSAAELAARSGLQVMDFHPIHVWLNGADMGPYEELKRRCPRLSSVTCADAAPLRRNGIGPGAMFREAIALLSSNRSSRRVGELIPVLSGGLA